MIPAYKRGVALRGTEPEDILGSLADSVRGKAASVYRSSPIRSIKDYDPNKLKRVGRTQKEEDAELDAEDEDDEETKARKKKEQEELDAKAKDAADDARSLNQKKSKRANIFSMLFKIVPIGLNISRRIPNVARGLKNIAQGFVQEMVGLATTSVRLFADHFEHSFYLFGYIYTWILCSIFKIFTLHKCIPFYVLDVILLLIYFAFFSVCFMLDAVLFLRYFFGFGLVDILSMIFETIESADRMIYTSSGIHVFNYPGWITKMCYRCDLMGDTTGIERASKKLNTDYTKILPKAVLAPLGKMAGGLGDVFSIFNI
jgi:hypothetical protein